MKIRYCLSCIVGNPIKNVELFKRIFNSSLQNRVDAIESCENRKVTVCET